VNFIFWILLTKKEFKDFSSEQKEKLEVYIASKKYNL